MVRILGAGVVLLGSYSKPPWLARRLVGSTPRAAVCRFWWTFNASSFPVALPKANNSGGADSPLLGLCFECGRWITRRTVRFSFIYQQSYYPSILVYTQHPPAVCDTTYSYNMLFLAYCCQHSFTLASCSGIGILIHLQRF